MISDGVYTSLRYDTINDLKEAINNILDLSGHGFHCDDFFDIYEDFDEDYAKDLYIENWEEQNSEEYTGVPTREELLEFIHNYNEANFDEGPTICTWITIAPISKEADKAAKSLDVLNRMFNINVSNDF